MRPRRTLCSGSARLSFIYQVSTTRTNAGLGVLTTIASQQLIPYLVHTANLRVNE